MWKLTARGQDGAFAYPELGESAIDKLVEALHRLHAMKLPVNPDVGPCTKNVGSIHGGRAPTSYQTPPKLTCFHNELRVR